MQNGMRQPKLIQQGFDQGDVTLGSRRRDAPVAMGMSDAVIEADRANRLAPVMLGFAVIAQQPRDEQVDKVVRCHRLAS